MAFEFRHESWFDDEVYETLRARDAALCVADTEESGDAGAPIVATADWGYLRLRRCDYDDRHCARGLSRIRAQPWQRAFVFFKHEDGKPLAWPAIERFRRWERQSPRTRGRRRATAIAFPATAKRTAYCEVPTGSSGPWAEPQPPLAESIAAGVAHEVRNPLNSVQINLSILEQELSEIVPDRDAHVFEVLRKIAGEIKRLDDFVSEFLRFARPPRLNVEPSPVRPLITDLAAFIAPECSKKGVASLDLDLRGPESCAGSTASSSSRPSSTWC